jgi:type I restriction enzyme S subunit
MYGGFNQIGRTGLLGVSATVNQALTAIRPQASRLDSRYLLNVLNFRVEHWKSVAVSTRKDPNITRKDVREFSLALPSIEEQKAIAAVLSDMETELVALEGQRDKARAIKQGMMQELLTGRIRLVGGKVTS